MTDPAAVPRRGLSAGPTVLLPSLTLIKTAIVYCRYAEHAQNGQCLDGAASSIDARYGGACRQERPRASLVLLYCAETLVETASCSKTHVIDDRGTAGYPIKEPSLGCARFRLHFHCVFGIVFYAYHTLRHWIHPPELSSEFLQGNRFTNSKSFSAGSIPVPVQIPCPATRASCLARSNPAARLQV